MRGIDYHTGVIFEAFVHHLGVPLCRGGRYDGLLGLYGPELPATGFSLDLVAVTEALHLQGGFRRAAPRGVFLVNFAADRSRALALARALRAPGSPGGAGLHPPLPRGLPGPREGPGLSAGWRCSPYKAPAVGAVRLAGPHPGQRRPAGR